MKFHGDIELQTNEMQEMVLETVPDFPSTAKVGRVIFLNQAAYLCVALNGTDPIWYPLTNKINMYTHTQDVAATTWTVVHNLNSTLPVIQVYDANGVIIPETIVITDANNLVVTFNTAIIGNVTVMSGNVITPVGIGVLNAPLSGANGFGAATINITALDPSVAEVTLSNGNLTFTGTGSNGWGSAFTDFGHITGKRYMELHVTQAASGNVSLGLGIQPLNFVPLLGDTGVASLFETNTLGYIGTDGDIHEDGNSIAYGVPYRTNDYVGMIADFDLNTVEFAVDGGLQGVYAMSLADGIGSVLAGVSAVGTTEVGLVNFGATPFMQKMPATYLSWDGQQSRSDFVVRFNPSVVGSALVLSNNDLTVGSTVGGTWNGANNNLGYDTGKHYMEMTVETSSANNHIMLGISVDTLTSGGGLPITTFVGDTATSLGYYGNAGLLMTNSGGTAYGDAYTAGDVIGMAVDLDTDNVEFFKNGVSQGVFAISFGGLIKVNITLHNSAESGTANFGASAFAHTIPVGFSSWDESQTG